MIGLHRLPLIEQKALDEWGTVSSLVGRQRRWETNKKQSRPVLKSVGGDARATAGQETGATVSYPVRRRRLWGG